MKKALLALCTFMFAIIIHAGEIRLSYMTIYGSDNDVFDTDTE